MPYDGLYLWEWFHEVLQGHQAINDGVPLHFTWTILHDWSLTMGRIVEPAEYAILLDMSGAWCKAMGKEISEARAREKAEAEAAAPPPKSRRGKR